MKVDLRKTAPKPPMKNKGAFSRKDVKRSLFDFSKVSLPIQVPKEISQRPKGTLLATFQERPFPFSSLSRRRRSVSDRSAVEIESRIGTSLDSGEVITFLVLHFVGTQP